MNHKILGIGSVILGLLLFLLLAIFFSNFLGARLIYKISPRLTVYQGEQVTLELLNSPYTKKLEICIDRKNTLLGYSDYSNCRPLKYKVSPRVTLVDVVIPFNFPLGRAIVITRARETNDKLVPASPTNEKIALLVVKPPIQPQINIEPPPDNNNSSESTENNDSNNSNSSSSSNQSAPAAASLDTGEPIDSAPPPAVSFKGTWVKYSANPVISEQSKSNWFQWPGDPFVMKDGPIYKMWFGANIIDDITQIGYATSPDGIKWSIHPAPVLLVGSSGQWDDYSVETPTVIKNSNGTYEMWYTGAGGAADDESAGFDRLHKIGYATSPNGINWTKHPKQVLDVNIVNPKDWDNFDFSGKADPTVIKENGIYKMWYTGAGSDSKDRMVLNVGYATSNNGINWTRRSNPVLTRGGNGQWDDGSVSAPSVFYDGSQYIMLYSGINEPEAGVETGSIGCAVSADGIKWAKQGQCINKSTNGFDKSGLWGITGMYNTQTGKFQAWYSGLKIDTGLHVSVGYTISK